MWAKCSSCKSEILNGQRYYVCNVSSCNKKRGGYVFCSVPCFERHVPVERHKDAYAIEEKAPAHGTKEVAEPATGQKRIIAQSFDSKAEKVLTRKSTVPREILIVASKLKDYIKKTSDMNTSAQVMSVLSDKVRELCDEAIEEARKEGRKTVLDRDFK
ncbi:MAG: hypothetical protein KDD50_02185 [Bdellovibrionales bacterium]|nr:hypothetical protein [Bdellovibrionales bacterium]